MTVTCVRPAPSPRDLIACLENGLAVITAYRQGDMRLSVSEVAKRCGITRTAARRYLITLCHLGFATCHRHQFALSPKVLRLGNYYGTMGREVRLSQTAVNDET